MTPRTMPSPATSFGRQFKQVKTVKFLQKRDKDTLKGRTSNEQIVNIDEHTHPQTKAKNDKNQIMVWNLESQTKRKWVSVTHQEKKEKMWPDILRVRLMKKKKRCQNGQKQSEGSRCTARRQWWVRFLWVTTAISPRFCAAILCSHWWEISWFTYWSQVRSFRRKLWTRPFATMYDLACWREKSKCLHSSMWLKVSKRTYYFVNINIILSGCEKLCLIIIILDFYRQQQDEPLNFRFDLSYPF